MNGSAHKPHRIAEMLHDLQRPEDRTLLIRICGEMALIQAENALKAIYLEWTFATPPGPASGTLSSVYRIIEAALKRKRQS